jgi:hypothetical protein
MDHQAIANQTVEEMRYSISMFIQNKKGYIIRLNTATRNKDWLNVKYWVDLIIAIEETIYKRKELLNATIDIELLLAERARLREEIT